MHQAIYVTLPDTDFASVLAALEAGGWRVGDVEGVSFVPAEADDHDWDLFTHATPEEAKEACRERESRGAIPSLVMMYGLGDFGARLIWSDSRVLVGSVDIGVPDPFDFEMSSSIVKALLDAGLRVQELSITVSAD